MTLIQAMKAFNAVCELMKNDEDYQTAYALYTAKLNLTPHAHFYAQEELKLIQKYAGTVEDGKFKIDIKNLDNFREDREKLDSTEIEFKKIKVKPFKKISGNQLEAVQEVFECYPE